MDELKFRRQVFSNPNCQNEEFLKAMNGDKNLEEFVNNLKELDNKLHQVLNIDVPKDLESKLLNQPQTGSSKSTTHKNKILLSIAASITFVVGISFAMLRLAPVDMAENALAHVHTDHHEEKALFATGDISFETVNARLASVKVLPKVSFTEQPGKITYLTYCDFQGVRGLHMVMEGKQDNVAVFIFPQESRMSLQKTFADGTYQGEAFEKGDAYLILVGKGQQDINYVKKEVDNTLI